MGALCFASSPVLIENLDKYTIIWYNVRRNADGLKRESERVMKKSVLISLIAVVLMMVCVLAFASCDPETQTPSNTTSTTTDITTTPDTEPHVHSFGEWVTVKEPTCTEKGELRRTCTRCDYHEAEAIREKGHTEAVAEAVAVKKMPSFDDGTPKITKVEIVCKEARLESLKNAMMSIGITGMTVTHVMGYGSQKGKPEYYRGVLVDTNLLPKIQVEMVVSAIPVRDVIEAAKRALYTGHIGDGKIFVYDVENVVKVRTGEEGYDALQDVE